MVHISSQQQRRKGFCVCLNFQSRSGYSTLRMRIIHRAGARTHQTVNEVRTGWGLAREIGNLFSKMAGEISDVNLMESPPDKVVLVGDVGVGKTSLFMRFKTGHFVEGTTHNPREGEFRKKWTINGNEVSVSF